MFIALVAGRASYKKLFTGCGEDEERSQDRSEAGEAADGHEHSVVLIVVMVSGLKRVNFLGAALTFSMGVTLQLASW